jgi:flagellar hook-associated protein 3 FlgL
MRVTQQTLFLQTNEGMQRAFGRVADLQEQAASGKRVNHFSDDPLGAARIFDLRGLEASIEQHDKNIDAAQPFLQQTDTVLGEAVDVLTRAKELTVAMANDSNSAQDRQLAAVEAGQLLQHMRSLANSDVAGRYLFAGFQNDTAPFSPTDAYLGDGGAITVQTSASTTLPLNLPGNQVFQGAGVPGGVGLLDVLSDLQTVLNAGGNATNPLSLSLGVNLDAAATTPASAFPVGPDDSSANWQAASNFSTQVAVFDSAGQAHNLTLLFRKTSATDWDYRVIAQRSELDATAPASADLRQVGAGTLTFNPDGTINLGGSTVGVHTKYPAVHGQNPQPNQYGEL